MHAVLYYVYIQFETAPIFSGVDLFEGFVFTILFCLLPWMLLQLLGLSISKVSVMFVSHSTE